MKIFFAIALRNIFRNKRRSLITASAVCVGLLSLIFLRGFVLGAQKQMEDNIKKTLTGDAQLIPAILQNYYLSNAYIEDTQKVRDVLKSDSRVEAFAERVVAGGLIASPELTIMSYLVGIDPDEEEKVKSANHVIEGRKLTNQDDHGVVLGIKMKDALKVSIGDKVVFTGQNYYGTLSGISLKVVGFFRTGNDEIDTTSATVTRKVARELLSLGDRSSKIVLKIDPKYNIKKTILDLRKKVDSSEIKILDWEELIPVLAQLMQFQNGMLFIVMMVVLVLAAASTLNTLMMSIVERTHEFGLMMALGTKPGQVVYLVALESFLLTCIGIISGVIAGFLVTTYFSYVGINLSKFVSTFSNFLIGTYVHPVVDWNYVYFFISVIGFSNVIISLYPAWRASRLDPVVAMRQIG